MSGITDIFNDLFNAAKKGNITKIKKILNKIKNKHYFTLQNLVGKNNVKDRRNSYFVEEFNKLSLISE
jgi:hypothetical protein